MLAAKEKERKAEEEAAKRLRTQDLKSAVKVLTENPLAGGYGFKSLGDFFQACLDTDDQHLSCTGTMATNRGSDLIAGLAARDEDMAASTAWMILAPELEREGKAIKTLLSRGSSTKLTEMLETFSMDQLAEKLEIHGEGEDTEG